MRDVTFVESKVFIDAVIEVGGEVCLFGPWEEATVPVGGGGVM